METLDLTQHYNSGNLPQGFTGEHFSVAVNAGYLDLTASSQGWCFDGDCPNAYALITALSGETITKLVIHRSYYDNTLIVKANGNSVPYTQSGNDFTYDNINASEVKLSANPNYSGYDWYCTVSSVDVYYTGGSASATYTVTWKDGDTVLKEDPEVAEGTIPTYDGEIPVKETADGTAYYPFLGWSPEVVTATEDATYTAVFSDTAVPYHIHDGIKFVQWTNTDSLPNTGGNYCLASDVTTKATWTVPAGETKLCLNGHKIDANGGNYAVITIGNGCTLNLYDPEGGGVITGANHTAEAGGVMVANGGHFNMYGGSIQGNRSTNGGGVSANGSNAVFHMYGGSIQYNEGYGNTGGILLMGNTTFTMSGGSIQHNAGKGFGGIGTYQATMIFDGDVNISDNYVYSGGTSGKIAKSGDTYTLDNTGGTPCNIKTAHANDRIKVTDQLTLTNKIGIIRQGGKGVFTTGYTTSGNTADPSEYFISDDANYTVGLVNGEAAIVNQYTVTWNNWDDSNLETDTRVASGAAPSYDGATPTKTADNEYAYIFAGWTDGTTTYGLNDALPAVTGNVTYTATFEATPNTNPDQAAADAVSATINALPTEVTVNDKATIEAARVAYEALTDDQKALVDADTLAKLTAAEEAFAAAADQAAADGVAQMINALPTEVTVNDKDAIEAARAAYEALSDAQKALVDEDTLKKLTDAEYRLNPAELVNTSAISAEKVTKGSAITINASAEGGIAPYKYTYRCKKSGAATWKYLATNSEIAALNYKPNSVGTYDIQVIVKDDNNTMVVRGFKLSVTEALKNKSTISETTVKAGSAVTLTADATGGTSPYTYTYRCRKSGTTTWKYIAANSETTTLNYKPNSVGEYDIQVIVKDADKTVVAKGFKLSVEEGLKNKSTISETTVKAGSAVTLTADATGGTSPYNYTYRCRKSGTTEWKYLAANSEATTLNYKPNSAGEYDIQIIVKDADKTVATKGFRLDVTE